MLDASIIAHGENLLSVVQNITHPPGLFKHWNALLENDERFGLNFFPESISEHIIILVLTVCVCMSMWVCMYVCEDRCSVFRKGYWIPWYRCFRQWVVWWVLRSELRSSAKAAHVLNHWAIAAASLLSPDDKKIWTGSYGMYGYWQNDWLIKWLAT